MARCVRVAAAMIVATVTLSLAPPASATPTVLGAGSTWSQIAIDQWRSDVVRLGILINYSGVGSTQGRTLFANESVDFGVSEIPYGEGGEELPSRQFRYLPIVAGGTSLMYNLSDPSGTQIRNLQLSSSTIAGIFTGAITNWSDPAIRRDYGDPLPNLPIKVVVRSDGSGTSYQYSAYLKAMEPAMWAGFTARCGQADAATSFYPSGPGCLNNGIAQPRSDGVANYIANPGLGAGAIGYVEAGYAIARRFPVAKVKNAAGRYAYPTARNVAQALQHAELRSDSTQELSGVYAAPEPDAYPISSYSYMIVPTDDSITTEKGQALGEFIIYFACTGQQAAERLGYSPMPKRLVDYAFDAVKAIPGAPQPPSTGNDGRDCPNPTLTGDFYDDASNPPPPGSDDDPPADPGDDPGGDPGSDPGGDPGDPGSDPGDPGDPGTGGPSDPGDPGGPGDFGENPVVDSNGDPIPGVEVVTASVPVMDDEQILAAQSLAQQQIQGGTGPSSLPLVVGAALVLLAVFGPLFFRLARNRRNPG